MATKKSDFMSLVKYLKAAEIAGVTAVGLDRAISAAIEDGTLTDMFPSTAKTEKYTIDKAKGLLIGMPDTGYQSYRNDYLILNEEQFDKWYTDTYLPSLTKSKGSSSVEQRSVAEIAAMEPEERAEYMRNIQRAKQKSKAATSVSAKKEREVKALIASGKFDEAKKTLDDWNTKGAESAAMKSGLMEEVDKARRNAAVREEE